MQVKRSFKNIFFGTLSQAVSIVLGVVIPRLFITSYGSGMNGLISSINQIFVYIGLFEAGIGAATLFSLYGPVARADNNTISGILSATNIYYKRTGIFYLISIFVFAAVYPQIIPTGVDTITVMAIILLTGIIGVTNYFFQGKYNLLLQAEGKSYIVTNIGIIVNILTSTSKIILLANGFNVIIVQSVYVVFYLLQIAYMQHYIKKHYQWLDLKVKPDFAAVAKKNSVLIHQISTLIFFNTDVIILTIFRDLRVVSVYNVYMMLFGVISTAIATISNGFTFSLGQMFNSDRNKYLKMHDAYEVYFMAIVFALFAIALIFITPFLRLYTAGITDISYIDQYLPVLFTAVCILTNSRSTASLVINFAGHFKETKWRSILESVINVTVSVTLVNIIGIYGVLIGTVAALLYRTNDMVIYANRRILNRSPWVTYRRILLNLGLLICINVLSSLMPLRIDTYIQIIIWAAVYCIIVIPLFFALNSLIDRAIFKESINYIRPYIRKALKIT